MTNEEILKKVIEKAKRNGWNPLPLEREKGNDTPEEIIKSAYQILLRGMGGGLHGFAKAFWGEGRPGRPNRICYIPWKYHLQHMILEEDPIKYLKKFL